MALVCLGLTLDVDKGFAATPARLKGIAVLGGGAPIAGGSLALVDGAGNTATAPINVHGRFTLATQGLTPPFLLQATPLSGAPLYGFAVAPGVANVDVYTDLIVNLVYAALSTSPAAQFTATQPLPTNQSTSSLADNLRLVSAMTQNLITSWMLADKIKTTQFTFFNNKFAASKKKFGLLAHQTSVKTPFASGAETIEISDGKATQDITFTSVPFTGEVTTATVTAASTTKLAGGNDINVSASTSIMVNAEQAAELDAINALLQTFQTDVNKGGKQLAATDIQALFNSNYLRGGEDLATATADIVTGLRGQKLSNIAVSGIDSILPDANPAFNDFNVLYDYDSGKQTAAPVTEVFQCPTPLGSGPCTFFGNQQLAQTQNAVQLSMLTESTLATPNAAPAPALGVDVLSPVGSLSAVTVNDTSNAYFNNNPVALTNTVVQNFFPTAGGAPLVYNEDENRLVVTSLSGPLPAPGLDFSITVTPTGGSPEAPYVTSLTGSPGEPVNLIQPALSGDHSLSAAPLGQTASLKWQLPTSYLVQSISVTGQIIGACGVGKQIQTLKPVTAKSTSTSIKFPSDISTPGDIQEVDINIGILGVNGAASRLVYAYGQCSP